MRKYLSHCNVPNAYTYFVSTRSHSWNVTHEAASICSKHTLVSQKKYVY